MRKCFTTSFLPRLLATLALLPAAAYADWECENDVEVFCKDGACETIIKQQHLPSTVTFNDSGEFSICIGGGCWRGTGLVDSTYPLLIISKENAEFSIQAKNVSVDKNIVIAFDPIDQVAVVKAGRMVLPLNCTSDTAVQESAAPELPDQCDIVSPEVPPPEAFWRIRPGMPAKEAREILGPPDYSPTLGVDYYAYEGSCLTGEGMAGHCIIGIDYHRYSADRTLPKNVDDWTVQHCLWGGIGE